MGMLQMAGVVSGGGKALQQGLQQAQAYMNLSMIEKERNQMELKRLDITYGQNRGLLHERANIDATARAEEQANRQANMTLQGDIDSGHITQKAKIESDQITQRGKVEGDLTTQKHDYNVELQGNELTAKAQENELDRKSTKDLTTLKLNYSAAEGAKERKAAMERVQAHLGGEIVKLTQQLQATKGSDRLPAGVDRHIDYLMEMIKIDGHRLGSGLLTPEEATTIERRLTSYGNQIKHLTLGESASTPRRPYIDPVTGIAKVDPWRKSIPLEGSQAKGGPPHGGQ